jgi:hypothetical protein
MCELQCHKTLWASTVCHWDRSHISSCYFFSLRSVYSPLSSCYFFSLRSVYSPLSSCYFFSLRSVYSPLSSCYFFSLRSVKSLLSSCYFLSLRSVYSPLSSCYFLSLTSLDDFCSPLKNQLTFRRNIDLIFRVEEQAEPSTCYVLHAGFLLDLVFESEDEGDMLFRNIN